jgi:hypothetical protein
MFELLKSMKRALSLPGSAKMIKQKMPSKPTKPIQVLVWVTNCEDCNGTGQSVDKAPQGVPMNLRRL